MMKFSFFVSLAKWVFKISMWVVFVACMDSQILIGLSFGVIFWLQEKAALTVLDPHICK
jgi:hypothetical protein